MSSERYIIGQEMLQRVDGKGGEAVVDSLRDIAPDFARYLIEFPFGDIYARPGLDLRSREIATIAALVTANAWADGENHPLHPGDVVTVSRVSPGARVSSDSTSSAERV